MKKVLFSIAAFVFGLFIFSSKASALTKYNVGTVEEYFNSNLDFAIAIYHKSNMNDLLHSSTSTYNVIGNQKKHLGTSKRHT